MQRGNGETAASRRPAPFCVKPGQRYGEGLAHDLPRFSEFALSVWIQAIYIKKHRASEHLNSTSPASKTRQITRMLMLFGALVATDRVLPLRAGPVQPHNLSTRMLVQTGDNVGIGGFIIGGSVRKHVLLRAMGPSLAKRGVPNVIADPALELHDCAGNIIATNNNWRDTQPTAIQTTGMAPGNDLEAAIDVTLDPGAYTAIVRSQDDISGLGLFEVYDLSPSADSKLANISTRAVVTPGDNTLIAGFILDGSGTDRIVLRGRGPSLLPAVPDPLLDPVLQLRDVNGGLVADNDNWVDNPQPASQIFPGFPDPLPGESEIVAMLPPGHYTALLNGTDNTPGVGLVELYDGGPVPDDGPPTVTRFSTGTFSNIESQHVVLGTKPIAKTFRLVFNLPSTINQSVIGNRAALQGFTGPISTGASAADIQAAIIAIPGYYAYGQLGRPEFVSGNFSYFADIGALNRDPIVTGDAKHGFTIQFGSTVGSPTSYNTWVAGLPLLSVIEP
jgi:hypothetical protein